ncbi:MAG: hypothetical protein H0U52_09250 [Chloroflexi bacterium]|nr:hypothetical protein [Chloroflexota bacterium]
MSRVLRALVYNWPLKLLAILLATLLYTGLVVSQSNFDFDTAVPIRTLNEPDDAVLLNGGNLPPISRIRYYASGDVGTPPTPDSFRATVNLAGIDPRAGSTYRTVEVESVDPRFFVVDYEPRGINIQLDPLVSKTVPVNIKTGPIPPNLEVRPPVLTPQTVTVSGPESVVQLVVAAQADVLINANGLVIDRDVPLIPVDIIGNLRSPVRVEPASVHVLMAVFDDRGIKTLPVTAVVTGAAPAGYVVESITVVPSTISVEGDPEVLSSLVRADTEPISINAVTGLLETDAKLALPAGALPIGAETVHVTIQVRAQTGTRTFDAGVALTGRRPGFDYVLSIGIVQVIVGGPLADLERLDASQFTVAADVAELGPGTQQVAPAPNLQAGLRLLKVDPATITITITAQGSPPPSSPPSPLPSGG